MIEAINKVGNELFRPMIDFLVHSEYGIKTFIVIFVYLYDIVTALNGLIFLYFVNCIGHGMDEKKLFKGPMDQKIR